MLGDKNTFLLSFTDFYNADYIRKIEELRLFQKLINTQNNLVEEASDLAKITVMSFEKAADDIIAKYAKGE